MPEQLASEPSTPAEPGIRRILILDDDGDFRALLRTWLSKMFAAAELEEYDPVARGAPDESFDWSRYDVLILDYHLRVENVTGLDILQANRKNRLFPAAIMLTGAGNEEVAVRAVRAGVYDYLRKEKLEKERLRDAILAAFGQHLEAQERQKDITQQSLAFNKAIFYRQLERPGAADAARERVLLLIQLDDAEGMEAHFGVILRDNVVRHVARKSFEVFQMGNCHPYITRLGEAAVALLVDRPASRKTLDFNLNGLCNYLSGQSYRFEDRKVPFTVSIGAVEVPAGGAAAAELIPMALSAVATAAATEGNSFHVWTGGEPAPAAPAAEPAPAGPPAETNAQPAAPAAAPAPAPAAAAPKPAADAPLSAEEEEIKAAFDEKRAVQWFRPVIALFNTGGVEEPPLYRVTVQVVQRDGSERSEPEIYAAVKSPALRQFMDRWLLRETIGRVVAGSAGRDAMFLLPLSGASLADPGLFNWLRTTLAGVDRRRPGQQIILELLLDDFVAEQRKAGALLQYLSKSHGFRFALRAGAEAGRIAGVVAGAPFSFVRLGREALAVLERPAADGQPPAIEALRGQGLRIVVDDVEDATTLTGIIAAGAHYAMGDFIGEPVQHLEDPTNVESFDIS